MVEARLPILPVGLLRKWEPLLCRSLCGKLGLAVFHAASPSIDYRT